MFVHLESRDVPPLWHGGRSTVFSVLWAQTARRLSVCVQRHDPSGLRPEPTRWTGLLAVGGRRALFAVEENSAHRLIIHPSCTEGININLSERLSARLTVS